jgi:hypothetical protein
MNAFWVVQSTIVSFVIIFVLHNLYSFFKETLTVPKMKDLVKRPQQKYDTLFRELRSMQSPETSSSNLNGGGGGNHAPDSSADAMKNELKRYLMELNAPAPEPEPQQQPSRANSNFIEFGSVYQ